MLCIGNNYCYIQVWKIGNTQRVQEIYKTHERSERFEAVQIRNFRLSIHIILQLPNFILLFLVEDTVVRSR